MSARLRSDPSNLPTEEQVKQRLAKLLEAKDYANAAKLMVYYAFCKQDPKEVAAMLQKKARELMEARATESKEPIK